MRGDERIEAALGLATSATTRFETAHDVVMAGVLAGLLALCANVWERRRETGQAAGGMMEGDRGGVYAYGEKALETHLDI